MVEPVGGGMQRAFHPTFVGVARRPARHVGGQRLVGRLRFLHIVQSMVESRAFTRLM
jgi:hypothetical protein